MLDALKITGAIIAGLAGLFLGLILLLLVFATVFYPFHAWKCHRYGDNTNRDVRVAYPLDCYVKMPNGWYDLEQINQNSVDHKGGK